MADKLRRKRTTQAWSTKSAEQRSNEQSQRFVTDAERLTEAEGAEDRFRDALRRVATAKPRPDQKPPE